MPIKKIVVSEEMINKLEKEQQGKSVPVYFITIPYGTVPENTGDYVLQEVQQNYQAVSMSATTSSAISFIAQQGAKEVYCH